MKIMLFFLGAESTGNGNKSLSGEIRAGMKQFPQSQNIQTHPICMQEKPILFTSRNSYLFKSYFVE